MHGASHDQLRRDVCEQHAWARDRARDRTVTEREHEHGCEADTKHSERSRIGCLLTSTMEGKIKRWAEQEAERKRGNCSQQRGGRKFAE